MEGEIFLLIGIGEKAGYETSSVEKAREVFKEIQPGVGGLDVWQVIHLGVPFTIAHPSPVDPTDPEICKKVLKAIHQWALDIL